MTKYIEIATDLEKQILAKKFVDKLPKEVDLAKKYKTSRVVISRALKLLAAKDEIKTVTGKGSFIKARDVFNQNLTELGAGRHDGFSSVMKERKEKVTSKIVSFSIRKPESQECQKLKIKSIDWVYDIIRERLVDGHPSKLEYTIMPIKVIPGITRDVLLGSIYSYIRNTLHLSIGKANRVITADKADAYDIDYLDCKKDDAILSVHQVAFLEDGRPFEYSETRDRYDRAGYFLFEVKN